ncbi:MAG TPA: helix-turn-helix transcriptional regulator [Candidatus Paceibacterota bacterium]|nr:helix-turn-helix transcriptional regulator [Candidatus Paceibacterota bacterium]
MQAPAAATTAESRLPLRKKQGDRRVGIHVGKRIRGRRRLLGLSQRHVAARCGVTFQQIQKYECAASAINATMLWKLAQALDVPVHYFFDGLSDED